MPFSLTPRWVFQHYSEITPDWLRQQGITLLLSDLDFTLAAKKTRRPDQSLRDWIAALRNAGIGFMIVSNNRSGSRVTEFCADLGVPYQGRAGKPSPRGLEAAMARAGADRVCTAMLGDKLLTDMLAARRAGVLALMVEPKGGARGRRLTLRVGRLRTPFTLNRPKSISRAADRKPTTGRCSARCALWPKKVIL